MDGRTKASSQWFQPTEIININCLCCSQTGLLEQCIQFLKAAVTKYHKLGGFKQQKLILSQFQGLESDVRMETAPCSLLRGKSVPCVFLSFWCCQQSIWPFLGMLMHHSNLCLHHPIAFSLYFWVSPFLSFWPHCAAGRFWFPSQGLNPCPLQWKLRV